MPGLAFAAFTQMTGSTGGPSAFAKRVKLVLLALLRFEAEAIDIAGLLDDAVECGRKFGGTVVSAVSGVLFGSTSSTLGNGETRSSVRRRRGYATIDRHELEIANGFGKKNRLLPCAFRVAEQPHFQCLVRRTARRVDGGRPRERADLSAGKRRSRRCTCCAALR